MTKSQTVPWVAIFPLPIGEKEVRIPWGLAVTEIFPALTEDRVGESGLPVPVGVAAEALGLAWSVLIQWCWASSMMAAMEGVGAFNWDTSTVFFLAMLLREKNR